MKRRFYIGAVLCMAVWGSAGPLMAQGLDQLLDKQLGGAATPAENATPKADPAQPAKPNAAPAASAGTDKPDAAKDKSPANPGGPDIISPDAVRKVDDADLLKQLTQPKEDDKKAAADKAAEQFADMMDRMGQSAHRLTDKDTGEVTQETQRRIVSDLDVLIEYARQQQQQSKPGPPGPPQQGQGPPQPSSGNQQGDSQGGGNVAAASSQLPGGGIADGSPGDMRSTGPMNWGDLPPRDRAQVSHGANEEALPSYRELIDRYYQALAEMGKTRNR